MIYPCMLYVIWIYAFFFVNKLHNEKYCEFQVQKALQNFFIDQYFLLTCRLQDWTLQSNSVNIMVYDCKKLIFTYVSSSSLFPHVTPQPTTLSISVVFTHEFLCFINSLIQFHVFDNEQKELQTGFDIFVAK